MSDTSGVVKIAKHFETWTDPRVKRTLLHGLMDIVIIAICGTIAGCDSWEDLPKYGAAKLDWLRQFLRLENGIPSADTFARVFQRRNADEFLKCFSSWTAALRRQVDGEIVALDGQTLRGSGDDARGPLHLVRAFATENRLVLGQEACAEKSNEITAIPKLLKLIEISGAIVTIDARGCQTEIAQAILDREADYVLHVKDNQPKLHAAVQEELGAALKDALEGNAPAFREQATHDTAHGRCEERTYYSLPVPKRSPVFRRWPGVRSLGMVVRVRTIDGRESREISDDISSLRVGVKRFAKAVRSHWGIENHLHWMLDVNFGQDASRIRKASGSHLASLLRQLALTLLQRDQTQRGSLRGKRKIAGWDNQALEAILAHSQVI